MKRTLSISVRAQSTTSWPAVCPCASLCDKMILGGKRSISLTKGSEELSKELILNGEAIREPVLEAMREDTTGLQCCYKSRIRSVTRALQGDLLLRIRRAHDSPMRDGAHDSPTGHDPKTFITALLSAAHSEKSSFTEEACLLSLGFVDVCCQMERPLFHQLFYHLSGSVLLHTNKHQWVLWCS